MQLKYRKWRGACNGIHGLTLTAALSTWWGTLHSSVKQAGKCVWGSASPSGGTRWIACRPSFFLPVRVLSRLFRRPFLQNLQDALEAGELRFFGKLAGMAEPTAFATGLDQLRRTLALFAPRRFATSNPQRLSKEKRVTRDSGILAAS
jgi:hypothetical protein